MLCKHVWIASARLLIRIVSGARDSGGLWNVRRFLRLGGSPRWLSSWRSNGEGGQGLIEFAIVFGFIGASLSLMWWLISSLAADVGVAPGAWLIHLVYAGSADWLLRGKF